MRTLFYQGREVVVLPSTLSEMGLKNGDEVSQEQISEALELDAAALFPEMERRRRAGEPGVPDPAQFKGFLNH
ncbi:MAG: hypothetical protein G01um101456_357 [Parcubacteria group bacterium Gr01-1014_56]|nr:MAG: hypothetical protein G01um101456_357 [Parcubacteria group bacterium Gr01-1014_56]